MRSYELIKSHLAEQQNGEAGIPIHLQMPDPQYLPFFSYFFMQLESDCKWTLRAQL